MNLRRPAIAASLVLGGALPLVVPLTPAAAAARSLCAPPADTVGPTVTQVTFGTPSIDLNSGSLTQTVTASASDTSGNGAASGVASLDLEVRGNRFGSGVRMALTSGTATSGQWTGQFAVSKYARPGTYSIAYLSATDAAGNLQNYSNYNKVPEGPNSLSLNPADDPTFTVTGTPAKPPARKPAGRLKSFAITPSHVDTTAASKRVNFTAQFTGAAPHRVSVNMRAVKRTKGVRPIYLDARLRNHDGTWSGTARVPQWVGDQKLQASLFVDFGRRFKPRGRAYNPDQLARLDFPSKVSVVSKIDTTRPTLTSLSFAPSSIDSTTGTEVVTVTAQASDTGSGVRSIDVNANIHHGINGVAAGSYPFADAGIGFLSREYLHVRLKQTDTGDWVGTTKVRQCVPSGKYKLDVGVSDHARNEYYYTTKRLAKAGITSTVDVTSKHGDVVAPYVYSAATYAADKEVFLNFSEGVANVTTSTLTVYPLSPKSTRFTTPSAVTAIKCSDGTSTVDCSGSGGLVTSAVLTIPSITPGEQYDVFSNLGQITAQLVDGNGNPMDWNDAVSEVKAS